MKAHGFHFESALVQRPKLARRALLVLAFFATPAIGSAQFTITCAGDGSYPSNNPLICPCGNVSVALAGEGCVNSTGFGTTLRPHPNPAIGVDTSVALDNLNLLATHPPGAGNGGLLLIKSGLPLAVGIATWAGNAADFEGMLCVGGGLRAMPGPGHPAGTRDLLHVYSAANALAPGFIVPGATYSVQYWHRDVINPVTPCPNVLGAGANANFSNALTFVATP